jgi:hypothetical protein
MFSIMRQQQGKTSRTGKRAIQLAGSAVEGLASGEAWVVGLGFDPLVFILLPGNGGVVFEKYRRI